MARSRSRDRRKKSRSREKRRSRSRDRKDRDRKHRSRSRDRKARSRSRKRSRDRAKDKGVGDWSGPNHVNPLLEDPTNIRRKLTHFTYDSPPRSDKDEKEDGGDLLVEVTNLPAKDDTELLKALNKLMLDHDLQVNLEDPIVKLRVIDNAVCAEFHDPKEADKALKLNGVVYEGQALKLVKKVLKKDDFNLLGGRVEMVPVTPERLCLHGLTPEFSEDDAKELIEVFGDVKFWHCVRSGPSQPVRAVFEFVHFVDERLATECVPKLSINGQKLEIMKPEEAVSRGILNLEEEIEEERRLLPSKALFLKNVVTAEELGKDEDFDEIFTDIKLECESCSSGKVLELIIPRPSGNSDIPDPEGLGYAFVKFETITQATKAKRMMAGRKFGDNAVEVEFFSVKKFDAKELADPTPNTDAPEKEDMGLGEEDMALEDGAAEEKKEAADAAPAAPAPDLNLGATPLAPPPPPMANGAFVD